MDTRLTSQVPYANLATVRHEAAPVREAVRTELPPPVAVSAQVGAEQVRWSKDARHAEGRLPRQQKSEMSVETDRETGDLVYKVMDPESQRIIMQYPYESLLRLRAYIQSQDKQNVDES